MSTKYTFTSEFTANDGDKTTTTKEFTDDTLCDVLREFREFLLGCGFSPKLVDDYLGDEY